MLRLCIIGAFDPAYARHDIIRSGLEAHDVTVTLYPIEKNAPTTRRIRHLLRTFAQAGVCDVILIPCFNQVTAPLAWLLAKRYGKPLIVDYLVGLSDLLEDRRVTSAPRVWLMRQLDRLNTRLCLTLTDSAEHRRALQGLLQQSLPQMHILPVGVRDLPMLPLPSGEPLVQYTGTYIPFHGVDVIIRAAQHLPQVTFELIGSGQTYADNRALSERLQLANVRFVEGYVPTDELLVLQARSTLMLGVFGDAPKTNYVVPNKVYEALALGRPLITAESDAVREFLTPGDHLITVAANDPIALADAIQDLLDHPEKQAALRTSGRQRIEEAFLPQHIGARLLSLIRTQLDVQDCYRI